MNLEKDHAKRRLRGHSSAGRALAWHARGRRFDPAWLHHASSFGLRVAQPRRARRTKRGARRSPTGEEGLTQSPKLRYSPTTALNRSRNATISSFIAVSSPTEQA